MSLWAEIHTYGQETPIVRNDNPLNNLGSDSYIGWYIDTQPEPYDFQEPYEPDPEQYDLQPRVLDNEFDFIGFSEEMNNAYIKKYNIVPSLFCEEAEAELEEIEECSICYEQMKRINAVTLNCEHRFCGGCIKQTLECHTDLINNPSCALCRTTMTSFCVKNPDTYNEISLYCR
jgi:hypothetical protein